MTKAAKEFDKRLQKFWATESTFIYTEALAYSEGKLAPKGTNSAQPHDLEGLNLLKSFFVQTSAGTHGGTWAYPRLATKFACWLDPAFEIECMYMIDEILKGNLVVTQTEAVAAMVQQPTQAEPEHSAMSRLVSAAVDVMRGLLEVNTTMVEATSG